MKYLLLLAVAAFVGAVWGGELIVTLDYLDEPLAPAHSNGMTRAGIRMLAANYRKAGAKAIAWRVANLGVGAYRTGRLSTMKWAMETSHPERERRLSDKVKYVRKGWPDSLTVPYQKTLDAFDPLAVACEAFHAEGLEFWMFVDLYDEQYSRFLSEHPECLVRTPDGAVYPGLRNYANETAVAEKLKDIAELYKYKPDALYLCTSCHARHLDFPEPDGAFGTLPASKLTGFLRRLRRDASPHGVRLVMGLPFGKTMDFCSPHWAPHPRYRIEQDWRTWIDEGLVDALVLGDYQPLWANAEFWGAKGLSKLEPGRMPLDVFAPEIRDHAKGRVKLYVFGGWQSAKWLAHDTEFCAQEVKRLGLDGYLAHESVTVERAENGYEALLKSVDAMTARKGDACGVSTDWSYDGQTTLNLKSPLVTERVRLRVLADTHLTLADVRDAAFASHYRRMAQWGAKPAEFEASLPRPDSCDFLVLAGDNLSFPTLANVEYLKGRLDGCGVPYGYVAGNHDWHFEGEPGSDFEQRDRWTKSRLKPLYCGRDPLMSSVIVKGLRIVFIDNSLYHVTPEQLAFWKRVTSDGLPVVLVMHIPFWNPGWSICTCCNPQWGAENDPYWEIERRERWAKELLPSTWAFRKAVLETPSLIAVLTGHEHRFMASSLADKLQFVAPGNGAFLDVILLPGSSGCNKGW